MIKAHILGSIETKQKLLQDEGLLAQIKALGDACAASIQAGGKIIFAGNGGSFADAQHLSAEFTSRLLKDRRSLPSLALGCNSSAISAIGNDYGFEHAFSRELSSIGTDKDVFIPISTSGNSPNILMAIETAKKLNIKTVGLTGLSGGKMKAECECICVPSSETPRIQESHILIGHIICGLAEAHAF